MISAEDIEAFRDEEPDLKWSDFFDVRSGVLIHKERDDCPNWVWNARYAGKPAGTIRSDGYIRVKVNARAYYAHVIVFEMFNGKVPEGYDVDHIDRNRSNNDPRNLRLATRTENKFNGPAYRSNKSGYRGVSFHKRIGKYAAGFRKDGKSVHLGYFDDPEVAHQEYLKAAQQHVGSFADGLV